MTKRLAVYLAILVGPYALFVALFLLIRWWVL